jgi:hypothetical protein
MNKQKDTKTTMIVLGTLALLVLFAVFIRGGWMIVIGFIGGTIWSRQFILHLALEGFKRKISKIEDRLTLERLSKAADTFSNVFKS